MNKVLRLSATQVETYDLCRRKWWLKAVRKLVDPPKGSTILGTVIHAVIDRWLSADDNGRDASGNAVDLYPEGWQKAVNRYDENVSDGEISLDEQSRCKRLVQTAIESGVLMRYPGRRVERQFNVSLADGVLMMGFIDCQMHDMVVDHKSTKAMRYAKSPAELRKNSQMLIYAKICLLDAEKEGRPKPAQITLRHNVFCVDANDLRVRPTEAVVIPEEVEAEWTRLKTCAEDMVWLRAQTKDWSDISDPPNMAKSCNAYGGCPYSNICQGKENEVDYERRMAKVLTLTANPGSRPAPATVGTLPLKGTLMIPSVQSRLAMLQAKQQAGSAGAASAPPAAAPVVQPPPVAAPAPVLAPSGVNPDRIVEVGGVRVAGPAPTAAKPVVPAPAPASAFKVAEDPPWYNPTCRVCSGLHGFNSRGNPCKICDSTAAMNGRPSAEGFEVVAMPDGLLVWEERGGGASGSVPAPSAATPVKVQETVVAVPAPEPVVQKVGCPTCGGPQATTQFGKVCAQGHMEALPAAPVPEPVPPVVAVSVPGKPVALMVPPPQPAPVEEEAAKPEPAPKAGRGAPTIGFTLCINSVVVRTGGRRVVHLDQVFKELSERMATEAGVASYYDLDVWKRRDAFAKAAAGICKDYGPKDMLQVVGLAPAAGDMKSLVDAIMPLAGTVIGGM